MSNLTKDEINAKIDRINAMFNPRRDETPEYFEKHKLLMREFMFGNMTIDELLEKTKQLKLKK